MNPQPRFEFRTECLDDEIEFTIRTVCSVYLGDAVLLQAVSIDTTTDPTFQRILERFEHRGSRWMAEWVIEVQRNQAREQTQAVINRGSR